MTNKRPTKRRVRRIRRSSRRSFHWSRGLIEWWREIEWYKA
jgi:hypothetical protein